MLVEMQLASPDELTEEKSVPHDNTNQLVASQNTVKNNNELSDKTDRL